MVTLKERYVVDERGNRAGILLEMEDYRKLLEELEELEAIPFEEAVAEIKRDR
ncbi:MAG: hypothetical protein V3W08_03415 [Candidatus Binatia bacterium]